MQWQCISSVPRPRQNPILSIVIMAVAVRFKWTCLSTWDQARFKLIEISNQDVSFCGILTSCAHKSSPIFSVSYISLYVHPCTCNKCYTVESIQPALCCFQFGLERQPLRATSAILAQHQHDVVLRPGLSERPTIIRKKQVS